MTVRIETTVIPPETIETQVVSIFGPEWESMRRGRFLLNVVGSFFWLGAILYMVTYWHIHLLKLTEMFERDFRTPMLIIAALFVAITLVLIGYGTYYKAAELQDKLLIKHGWDGKSRYRVELEWQTFDLN